MGGHCGHWESWASPFPWGGISLTLCEALFPPFLVGGRRGVDQTPPLLTLGKGCAGGHVGLLMPYYTITGGSYLPSSSLGAHSQPGAALWLSPEEESHTRLNIFASLYLQNLDLGDGLGYWGGGWAIAFTRLH